LKERKSGKFVAKKEVCFLGKKEKKIGFVE